MIAEIRFGSTEIINDKLTKIIFILILGFFLINISVFGQDNEVQITGKVLDYENKPVKNVIASLVETSCKDCLDLLGLSSVLTDTGKFLFTTKLTKKRKIKIYIEEYYPNKMWSFLYPVESTPLKQFAEFGGIEVEISKPGKIDLGEIYSYIKYETFTIDYKKVFRRNEKLLKTCPEMIIDLKYKGSKIVQDLDLDEREIDREKQTIMLILPHGEWNIEIKTKDKKHKGKVIATVANDVNITY